MTWLHEEEGGRQSIVYRRVSQARSSRAASGHDGPGLDAALPVAQWALARARHSTAHPAASDQL